MIGKLTRSAARNTFFFGSLFLFVVFLALTIHTHLYMLSSAPKTEGSAVATARSSAHTSNENGCKSCYSIFAEQGAYSHVTPEQGNAWNGKN